MRGRRGARESNAKRWIDVTVAALALLLLAPVLLVIAVVVRVSMGTPVFFRQTRPGLDAKPFEILKFRTMRERGGSDGERLTPLGMILRSTSLDELPELWNVLRGEMSVVGPRPLLMKYLDRYSRDQFRRHEVRPGITGWAQVNGRNALTWEERLDLDVWYVDNWRLGLDFRILLMTIGTVISRRGIHQEGHATMEEFRGSRRSDP